MTKEERQKLMDISDEMLDISKRLKVLSALHGERADAIDRAIRKLQKMAREGE